MGGPMSVNDPLPWIPKLIALLKKAIAAHLPIIGHCLGGQLLAKALGAPVGPNPVNQVADHLYTLCALFLMPRHKARAFPPPRPGAAPALPATRTPAAPYAAPRHR